MRSEAHFKISAQFLGLYAGVECFMFGMVNPPSTLLNLVMNYGASKHAFV
jgi:hypothetical protein